MDKTDLRKKAKYIALSNLSICYTSKNIKESLENNKLKISARTWNEEFDLPAGSSSISDIQDYFEYILKKHREKTINPSIKIYINKIQKRIMFKIKAGYYIEILTPESIKLRASTKSGIAKNNGEKKPHLEITEVVLIHCNVVNNSYQQNSRVLYTFVLKNP